MPYGRGPALTLGLGGATRGGRVSQLATLLALPARRRRSRPGARASGAGGARAPDPFSLAVPPLPFFLLTSRRVGGLHSRASAGYFAMFRSTVITAM
eukprot:scaffold206347_cov28-Tisochrysis_lutea.AAC.1